MQNKKAALELSIGTIVIIVLAMTMLILGLVLVRTIFAGATYNVKTINDKVRGEINKLFTEEDRLVIYLADNLAEVKQGKDYGVVFGIKNLEEMTVKESVFSSDAVPDSDNLKKCGLTETIIESWMTGKSEKNIPITPGQVGYGLVRFNIPKTAPLCTIRFRINIEKDKASYASGFFDLKITS